MKKFIENLQNQPLARRRRSALVGSLAIFICVVFLWAVSFVYGLKNKSASPDVVEVYKKASPFATLTNNFGDSMASIRQNFVDIFSKGPGTPTETIVTPTETAPKNSGL